MIVRLSDPNTFLTPNSLDLLVARAVERFMKLMADSANTKRPIAPKILMKNGFPVGPKACPVGEPAI